MNYEIIKDEAKLDSFIAMLPDTLEDEVFYLSLFGRRKWCEAFPNMRDEKQISRFTARKDEIKEKIARLACPLGTYMWQGMPIPQEAIGMYIALNPKNLRRANKNLLIEMAKKIASGETNFNPIGLATTEIHKAGDRKFFVDFDFDGVNPEDYVKMVGEILPVGSFELMKTRGGFHLLVKLDKVKGHPNKKWYQQLSALYGIDVRGTGTLTPVAGCCQGGFTPYFL